MNYISNKCRTILATEHSMFSCIYKSIVSWNIYILEFIWCGHRIKIMYTCHEQDRKLEKQEVTKNSQEKNKKLKRPRDISYQADDKTREKNSVWTDWKHQEPHEMEKHDRRRRSPRHITDTVRWTGSKVDYRKHLEKTVDVTLVTGLQVLPDLELEFRGRWNVLT